MTPEEQIAFVGLLKRCPPGPRIEMGVYRGRTLRRIALHDGITIGVDSFSGMAKPTEQDIKDGWNPYPAGRFEVSPQEAQGSAHKAILVKGFVPDVLPQLDAYTGFAFAHLDMDHYWPTLHALRWLWPRMKEGGILCCDDWFGDREWLAAGAINRFAEEVGISPETVGRKAWWEIFPR